ncbi:hypothetical protein FPZ12_021105 [Amycolatopsis acidicola]|uniref:ABC transporter substrate-binding protein n=1 Tax=Amycolatopsis acidicola TaxID=2596893 RepID=A0A5N0V0F1_9PSEU|nr:hypothetical protein [Amycolatopsis acidicola]KAA9159052.1 hypothetical protein FPZ12_021105 [Amycolatopsis acidicola]
MTNRIPLTIAATSYDLAIPVTSGEIELAGVEPSFVDLPLPGTLAEFLETPSWDVAEVPAAEYVARRLSGHDDVIALPVFLSRMFRHGCLHVTSRIRAPEDLRGARVAVASGETTTAVWVRGMLSDMFGVGPDDVTWVDGAELLGAGGVDAVISARPPAAEPGLTTPLFGRPGPLEREYLGKTRSFPILNVLAVRPEILARHRWLASNLYRAFEIARRRYFYRLEDIRASRVPIPSVAGYMHGLRDVFGGEVWPYGIDPNRPTLETLVRYLTEQGLAPRESAGTDIRRLFAPYESFVDGM